MAFLYFHTQCSHLHLTWNKQNHITEIYLKVYGQTYHQTFVTRYIQEIAIVFSLNRESNSYYWGHNLTHSRNFSIVIPYYKRQIGPTKEYNILFGPTTSTNTYRRTFWTVSIVVPACLKPLAMPTIHKFIILSIADIQPSLNIHQHDSIGPFYELS